MAGQFKFQVASCEILNLYVEHKGCGVNQWYMEHHYGKQIIGVNVNKEDKDQWASHVLIFYE